MRTLGDLTGNVYGHLKVIGPAEGKNGRKYWKCVCDLCGREKDVQQSNLVQGYTTMCGHHRPDKKGKINGPKIDLTGQTFGELTAIEFVKSNTWRWRCSCGKIVTAEASAVKSGKVVSCGHVHVQKIKENYEKNNPFQQHDGSNISVLKAIVSGRLAENNTSGYTGIWRRPTQNGYTYVARIGFKGKKISLGTFSNIEDAITARKEAERKYFGSAIEDYEFEKAQEKKENDEKDEKK